MRLGEVLRKYRVMKEINLRDLGREIGVAAATLMRIEHGKNPDAVTFMKILNWLTK